MISDRNTNEKLPSDWEIANIEDIAEVNPRIDKSVIKDNLPVSFVPMPAVTAGTGFIDVTQNRPFSEVKKGYTGFLEGDVLFAKITPCMENGKMAIVPKLVNGYGFGSTEFHVLRPKYKIEARYLYYFVSNENFRRNAAHNMTGAVGQKRVPTGYIKESMIPVAPLNEQKRIVAQIEKQFSRLDEAVDNLKRVKANLKRYKSSVLKAAVEGKLTEEWRKADPDVEPADKLLERILAERRKKWEEAELAKMKAKGKGPKDDKWKKKYKEPDVADQIDMKLPSGWAKATVKQLSERVQYGSSSKTDESSDGIPVLRMGNIFEGKLLIDKLKYLPESHDEFPELLLKPDDLLFNRTNSPELVGKTAVYKGNPSPCSFASYLIRVRFIIGVEPNFISYFTNSNYGRKWIKSVVSQQVGQANVNGTKLQALSVPLPPYIEQGIIVSEVENKFSIIGELEKQVDFNLKRAERLRQSILKKAFLGQLLKGNIEGISKLE